MTNRFSGNQSMAADDLSRQPGGNQGDCYFTHHSPAAMTTTISTKVTTICSGLLM
jgi:hypothetical protein